MKNKEELASFVPTKTELNVLEILWEYGPSTVRFVHDKLNEQKEAVIYTSTLKLMQVMKEKGVLDRDDSQMKHVYRAVLKEEKVKGNLLIRFVDQFYQGSPSRMMVSLLGTDKTSEEELKQMRDMINNTNLRK